MVIANANIKRNVSFYPTISREHPGDSDPHFFDWQLPPGLTIIDQAARVERVYDGDTIKVSGHAYQGAVRLIGIDAPEICTISHQPHRGAYQSRNALVDLILGLYIALAPSGLQPSHDAYGRLVAYVWRPSGGLLINGEMLRQGWARVPSGWPHELKPRFLDWAHWAVVHQMGLWSPHLPEH